MVLVDSSVWIEAARRTGDLATKVALEGLLDAYEATLCDPVRLEVLGGARREDRRRWATGFAVIPQLSVSAATWGLAVEHSWKYRDAGLALPWNDILVAALSVQQGCRVYARDRHFEQMVEVVGIRPYRPGYGGAFAPDAA